MTTFTSSATGLRTLEIFIAAADATSFQAAATALGLSPAAVSRAIARLETRLGVRLFQRTTRRIAMTEEGRFYRAEVGTLLRRLAEAEDALVGRKGAPAGSLRISVGTVYGHHRLMPLLPAFQARYPDIAIDVHVSNDNIDLIDSGFDVAIRLGIPEDNRLVARRLEEAALGVFASPGYLAQFGTPAALEDLASHRVIVFDRPRTGRPFAWQFRVDGRNVDVTPAATLTVTQDPLACLPYARADGGLVQTYDFVAADDVARGTLVEVLRAFRGRTRPFSLLYPQNTHLPARVGAFVAFLTRAERQRSAKLTRP